MAVATTLIVREELCLFIEVDPNTPIDDILVAAQQRADEAGMRVVLMEVSGRIIKVSTSTDLVALKKKIEDRFNGVMVIE